MVGPLELLIQQVRKIGLQKNLHNFSSDFGFYLGVMRGFQKVITLGGRISGRVNLVGLQKWVAKKFAKFLHLIWDLSRGS